MARWARRGRPKTTRADGKDRGTPELQIRKRLGLLAEPVDLCRDRGLISMDEHWCAMHFRWLYTLRYGLPCVTAINLDGFGGLSTEGDDEWNSHREQEFHEAMQVLRKCGAHREIINLAVMNIAPAFLISCDESSFRTAEASLSKVKTGLAELCNLWLRGRKKSSVTPVTPAKAHEEPQHLHQ